MEAWWIKGILNCVIRWNGIREYTVDKKIICYIEGTVKTEVNLMFYMCIIFARVQTGVIKRTVKSIFV